MDSAQLDLEAEVTGVGDGRLERADLAHQVGVGDGHVVPHRQEGGVAGGRELRLRVREMNPC